MKTSDVSVIIPCKDEARSIGALISGIREHLPGAAILVMDDGSSDDSAAIARAEGATVMSHPYSMGNGAAIKAGIRAADTSIVVCMDADGQHRPEDIPPLLEALDEGFEMAVGARSTGAQASSSRRLANTIYNRFAGWMVGHKVPDLTSGMRAFKRSKALDFLHLLPNGFSYPTTLTMAFFRAGYAVRYVPIRLEPRVGKSHISPFRDGVRFLLIIFKVGTLYSPLKVFFPLSALLFATGLGYYLFTYWTQNRFTNMGALLFLTSVIVFLMGLLSEQVTSLLYQSKPDRQG